MILDLMSSWVSYLPPHLIASAVIGHGMNVQELAANPRLSRHFVQDLNRTTDLPLDTAGVDAVLCCVGVQYLQKPSRCVQGGCPRPPSRISVRCQLL